MRLLGSLRTWLLFNNKINPQKYNLPNNSALPVQDYKQDMEQDCGYINYKDYTWKL